MHLLRTDSRSLDETEAAVDLGQTPADILFLSFSDSDLSLVAAAAQRRPHSAMSLRLANLGTLKHPYSVDLYVEKILSQARFVLIRLLGGLEYWRYGIEEFSRAARARNFALAIVPGDAMEDFRLDAASTVPAVDLRHFHAAFQNGGLDHIAVLLDFIEGRVRAPHALRQSLVLAPIPSAGRFEAGCRKLGRAKGHAYIVFYRSLMLAGDTKPISALADCLAARGLETTAIFVASLKDADSAAFIQAELIRDKPDVIVNTTGFSSRLDAEDGILDAAGAPVLQAIFSGASEAHWRENPRGLGTADLAMNVVLPEMDGRLITRAIACKAEAGHRADLEFTPRVHVPLPSRVNFVADLAAAWVNLRRTPRASRKIVCVLSDYPGKEGRSGYAVGLDTEKSVISITNSMREAGYTIGPLPGAGPLMRRLEDAADTGILPLAEYVSALDAMPHDFVRSIHAHWGTPDTEAIAGQFTFPVVRTGHLVIALQPDRGIAATRKTDYHDTGLPPCHSYVAFYIWLRHCEKIDAMIHCGTHGTLEWLPGKAVALSEACAPEAVLGALPVIYPFIVNNPGEAAQAKRRICALTIGHMTPPLTLAGSHGAALEIEALFDEYAIAESLDPKRARLLSQAILARANETGLLQDSGLKESAGPDDALRHLDAWLCDLKDMRIADGLHVFGRSPEPALRDATVDALAQSFQDSRASQADSGPPMADRMRALIDRCGEAESASLLAALDGRFVAPGPGGAPSRGRIDVLPTGRNLYGIDPRAVPTRTAWEIGRRAALEVMNRHVQDHGEWPKRIVMDIWASAAMRTGGDDLAHAFALMGVKPIWDHASSRLTGFEILAPARMAHPRVDVTLRISGLFRDVFPAQIALFDQAVQALSECGEEEDVNPFAAARRLAPGKLLRVFGAAPGTYGIGLTSAIGEDASLCRETLGERYLATASHAYGGAQGEGIATEAFTGCVAAADALIHVQDQDEQDILGADAIIDHEGGFAAAAHMLGNGAVVYHVDSARPSAIKVRTLSQEIARIVRARASNPLWIDGQMRHGYRGAAEIAGTIENLYALAVLTGAVPSRHFELLFDATLGTPEVRDFLRQTNPKAARAIVKCFEEALARGFWRSQAQFIARVPRLHAGVALMTSERLLRKGWCPGARQPMPAKDGLLVRLRITGGLLAATTLRALAQAGRDYGNGNFDLTARGNLQIRGVREDSLPALIEAAGVLGLIDENAAAEAVRNVLVSPLSGLDGQNGALDAAKRLEAMLAANKDLHALPAKFGFLIDDGSGLSLGLIPADVRFDWIGGAEPFAIGIGGHANEAIYLGRCAENAIPAIASRLAAAFLRLGLSIAEPPRRMRGLIESLGATAIAQAAGLYVTSPPRRGAIQDPCPVGLIRFKGRHCFGIGAAFGSLDAKMLDAAAEGAEMFGSGEILLTPWRALIIPGVSEAQTGAISAYFAMRRFIVDRGDLHLAVAACGGISTCERGTTDARSDAVALMSFARRLGKIGVTLHVSGCSKGCGRQASTPLTLIAHEGLYDLVTDQTARDAGISDAKRLGLAAVHDIMKQIA